MKPDELKRQEDTARHIISALGDLSTDAQASPGFMNRVMSRAEGISMPHQRWRTWLANVLPSPASTAGRFAFAALLVIAIVGAVPQYASWIDAYTSGLSAELASLQEDLWNRNYDCSGEFDISSDRSATIEGSTDAPGITVWAGCPSGDVLVSFTTMDGGDDPVWWIPYRNGQKTASLLDLIVPVAHAATYAQSDNLVAATIKKVLCQKKLSNGYIVRRILMSDGKCYDETINPRRGKAEKREKAPCNCRDFDTEPSKGRKS